MKKNGFNACFICLMIGMIGCVGFLMLPDSVFLKEISVPEVDEHTSMIAFTFDDGPNNVYTEELLVLLQEEQAIVTFFLMGEHMEEYPTLVESIVKSGHQIANHTYSHPNVEYLELEEIEEELASTQRMLEAFDSEVVPLFRPPYGCYSELLFKLEIPVALWNVDSSDWEGTSSSEIYTKVMNEVSDGDIVVFHDDNKETIEAIRLLIPELKKQGYQFVDITTLLKYKSSEAVLNK